MIFGLAQMSPTSTSGKRGHRSNGPYAPFNIAHLMATQQMERSLAQMLRRDDILDLRNLEILDVGCGSGTLFLRLMLWGASPRSLHGIDLQSERVKIAQSLHPD